LIQADWIEAGAYVQQTLAALNAQLRRYIDESYLLEERRILQLVREIEAKALRKLRHPSKSAKLKEFYTIRR
jgi:DNA-directed RNA polymerase sigma subunit (sigma70/sigma32)